MRLKCFVPLIRELQYFVALTRELLHGLVYSHHYRRESVDLNGNFTLIACSCGKIWLGTEEEYLKREQVEEKLKIHFEVEPPFRMEDFDAIDQLKDRYHHQDTVLDTSTPPNKLRSACLHIHTALAELNGAQGDLDSFGLTVSALKERLQTLMYMQQDNIFQVGKDIEAYADRLENPHLTGGNNE